MRNVFFVTRHQDLAGLAAPLERAGMSVAVVDPAGAAGDDGPPRGDAVVLDLRDLGPAARAMLLEACEETGLVCLAAVDLPSLTLLAPDTPVEDFFVLPASAEEIGRRLERAIWRRHGIDTDNRVLCGSLSLDLANYRVSVDEEPVVLTFKEYELLRFLALNAGRVFTREQLLSRVWGYDYFGGARTVDVHIRRIRSKVEIHGHTFIETVRNVGYRLVAEARKYPAED